MGYIQKISALALACLFGALFPTFVAICVVVVAAFLGWSLGAEHARQLAEDDDNDGEENEEISTADSFRNRFTRLYWRAYLRVSVARGWRASSYSGVCYWPLVYGVSMAWRDAYEFNRTLSTLQFAMQASIAEMRAAILRCH